MNDTCENCEHMGKSTSGYVGMYCKYTGEAVDGDMNCVDWEAKDESDDFEILAKQFIEDMGELIQILAAIMLDNAESGDIATLKEELAEMQIDILQMISLLGLSIKDFEMIIESELEI